MTILDTLIVVRFERLNSSDAVTSWVIWNRVFAAYRLLYGESLDLLTDRGEWI